MLAAVLPAYSCTVPAVNQLSHTLVSPTPCAMALTSHVLSRATCACRSQTGTGSRISLVFYPISLLYLDQLTRQSSVASQRHTHTCDAHNSFHMSQPSRRELLTNAYARDLSSCSTTTRMVGCNMIVALWASGGGLLTTSDMHR